MTELGIGLLGSGYMGKTYAECLTRYNSRVRLVAIAGGRRAPGLADSYGVAYEPDFDALGATSTRIVIAAGTESEGEMANRGAHAVAERLSGMDRL